MSILADFYTKCIWEETQAAPTGSQKARLEVLSAVGPGGSDLSDPQLPKLQKGCRSVTEERWGHNTTV